MMPRTRLWVSKTTSAIDCCSCAATEAAGLPTHDGSCRASEPEFAAPRLPVRPENSTGRQLLELHRQETGSIAGLETFRTGCASHLLSPPETVKSVNHFGLKSRDGREHRGSWQESSWLGPWGHRGQPGVENWARHSIRKCYQLLGICGGPPTAACGRSVNHHGVPPPHHLLSPPRDEVGTTVLRSRASTRASSWTRRIARRARRGQLTRQQHLPGRSESLRPEPIQIHA